VPIDAPFRPRQPPRDAPPGPRPVSAAAIPVTVLTGFLGAGKTTLVNRLLREAHGRRFAVIENEYGAVNVDADLLVNGGGETIVQLTNGCVCCTVRGDLADALERLAARRTAGEIAFDHVLIEPTGLADPGPIVRTFMAGTALQASYFLDGVVTLFDGLNGLRSLGESVEAQAQLAYADRVLVTKTDLLDGAAAVEALVAKVGAANSVAVVAGSICSRRRGTRCSTSCCSCAATSSTAWCLRRR